MEPLADAELLTEVVRALVDDTERVKVWERVDDEETYLRIDVSDQDRGKVIGKEGATIRALRVLFGRIGAVDKRKIFLEIEGDFRREGVK